MDKINILWIEDNPLQEGLYIKDLIRRDSKLREQFPKELDDYPVPAILFDKEINGFERYFNLQVLQHPLEIKDYISMCLKLEDTYGSASFAECNGVLPEIIVFDYHLGGKITANQGKGAMTYHPRTRLIREFINPNYKLKQNIKYKELFREIDFQLEKKESENYTETDFLKTISKTETTSEIKPQDKEGLKSDDFGLLTAIEILGIFRQHTTVAIPATFVKNQVENLSLHGKFIEWLNEYEYGVDFERMNRGSKKWDYIIKDAALVLQHKIENQLKLGKITVTYSHINDLSRKRITAESVFIFKSEYGIRSIPLYGLFIDQNEDVREVKVHEWATKLAQIYTEKTKISYSDYRVAIEKADELIDAYRTSLVNKRIELSKFIVRYLNGEILIDNKEFKVLRELFNVSEIHIQCFKDGKDGRFHSIEDNDHDFRKIKSDLEHLDRLIVLMTDIYLHFEYQTFCESNKNVTADKQVVKLLKTKPTYDDLLFALYPVPTNPLVLPYHLIFLKEVFTPEEMKKKRKQPYEAWEKPLSNLNMIEKDQEFPANLSDAELLLCNSFAEEIHLKPANFPNWLIKRINNETEKGRIS